MGSEMTNIIWVKVDKVVEYKYMGCYKDNSARLIPNFLGKVASIDECRTLAIKA